MPELLRLLWGTVLLRPYVFAFLAVYLLASSTQSGWRRTLLFLPLGYSIAWISEFSSIHWGFPYGDYFYIEDTLDRELWVMGVPFMDSLSYVFLAYCSFSTAIFLLSPVQFTAANAYILENHALRRSRQTLVLGAFLFVLLDIIIDPVALQGYRWFLGQIYGYREPGVYFGIPLSNFAGWLVVGFAMMAGLQGSIPSGVWSRTNLPAFTGSHSSASWAPCSTFPYWFSTSPSRSGSESDSSLSWDAFSPFSRLCWPSSLPCTNRTASSPGISNGTGETSPIFHPLQTPCSPAE